MHGHVFGNAYDAPVTAGLFKVSVAAPKNITQLIVGEHEAFVIKSVDSKLVQHLDEQLFNFHPPVGHEASVDSICESGILGQRREVFLGSSTEVPAILCSETGNLTANLFVGTFVDFIQKGIEVFAEQFSQAVMCNSFMKYCLLYVGRILVVGYNNSDFTSLLVVEAFCFGPFSLERRRVCDDFHIIQMQRLGHLLGCSCHISAFSGCILNLLFFAITAFTKKIGIYVVGVG